VLMICFPNAKINLGLDIVSKRNDGYHNIETVFYPIPLKDALEIVPSEKTVFIPSGLSIPGDTKSNSVIKAMEVFSERQKLSPIEIYLLKKIPFGAGLGGGSSDAAFMLKLLNDYTQARFSDEELEEMAATIGADCAFFIKNKPVFAEGIGNILTSVKLSLEGYYLALIHPEIHVSTQEAYAKTKPQQPKQSIKEIISLPVAEWKGLLKNNFEESVFMQYPAIGKIKEMLYQKGALYASMTGSGSSVFGIFDYEPQAFEGYKHNFIFKI